MKSFAIVLLMALFLVGMVACSPSDVNEPSRPVLWYSHPATYWNSQSLHLGNAFIGASFFGGVEREQFALTEGSMWTGGPFMGDWEAWGVKPGVQSCIRAIREAVAREDFALADSLSRTCYLGTNQRFGHFTSIGDLCLDMDAHEGDSRNYRRSLDLGSSLGKVEYELNGSSYQREYFCSYPHRVLAMKFTSDGPVNMGMKLGMELIQEDCRVEVTDERYLLRGTINGGAGRRFQVEIRALPYGGSSQAEGDHLRIAGCDSLVLFLAIATDYRQSYPEYLGEDPGQLCMAFLDRAVERGYEALKAAHVADYQELFDRVRLDLGDAPELKALSTDLRWERYRKGATDPGLEALTFDLGRYLIISSSRPGSLPANLQGKWNTFYVPPWTGNYQANINIQEIYWPCGPMNLLECQEPYVSWTSDLVASGRETARRVYGTRGWISHTIGNIWGHSTPVGGIPWGVYPLAPVWHCQHLWEQYRFGMDTTYLEETAWPIIREACQFWVDNLVEFQGSLVVAPSISAEHGALDPASGSYLYNLPSAQDAQMLDDLFGMGIAASQILDTHKAFSDTLAHLRTRLLPHRIGKHGQLQEWYADLDRTDDHHRHISHLYAVCPGSAIHPLITPELARAAARSLELRGQGRFMEEEIAAGGNWSMAWRMWCWARLMDGDRAHRVYRQLMSEQGFENLTTFQHAEYAMGRPDLYQEPDSLYLHFQLDASASIPGFFAEMLLQSHLDELIILPALPPDWKEGSVQGLKARGGFSLDISWKEGELKRVRIRGDMDRLPVLRLREELLDPENDKRIQLIHPS